MIDRLEYLKQQYPIGYLTIEQLLALEPFRNVPSLRALRRHVDSGRLDLRLSRLNDLPGARWIVYTHHLAEWLDRQEAAADAA
ncbi:MAG: pyocin activator PrtN family protein [Gammaproteobacteria bacterium]|uniref:Putative pyocin activator protein n=1 Tax=viral metagenome TaxID=1070528 RepID=A0A6M3J4A8_9ZZZZ|nr:pyocin activator PrtN family protein [Gammaproteobacteria bacterium]MBU2067500.1 pyocin activator PrtN family protein [Gammaproteobacteria bacterium]MBU2139510.1 pyocin activator PrtN family protein [Gammaproteobacteria bacterium]MBU2255938.1 pyocin activator PrtN family protein [Gammaproteobacteria bacterium]MBU2295583.1 pyocin activator PrtN family protein [Gammaproteobacteria bacterium]